MVVQQLVPGTKTSSFTVSPKLLPCPMEDLQKRTRYKNFLHGKKHRVQMVQSLRMLLEATVDSAHHASPKYVWHQLMLDVERSQKSVQITDVVIVLFKNRPQNSCDLSNMDTIALGSAEHRPPLPQAGFQDENECTPRTAAREPH